MIHKKIAALFFETGKEFINDRGLKMSAALAYYALFALPPLLIILINVLGYFFGQDAIQGEIQTYLNGYIGNKAALQIQNAIKSVHLSDHNFFATILSSIAFIFGATGVFAEMQDSLNLIWGFKGKPRHDLIKFIISHAMSFVMILCIGFVILVSLLISALLAALSGELKTFFPEITIIFFQILDFIISFGFITVFFAMIFKILPSSKVKYRNVIEGATITALMFILGKVVIAMYLNKSEIASTYGAGGSIIVLLIWVYYSSIILYLGAEFTKVYSKSKHISTKVP